MTRWYRAYAGTVKDDKIAEAATVAGVSLSVAIATWHSLLESAAETADGGRFETTSRRVAATLREPLNSIDQLFAAMAEIGMLDGDRIKAWTRRQYESDSSTERSRKRRQRLRNGDATLQQRSATPPEAEADTEVDTASAASTAPRRDYAEIERRCRSAAGLENEPSPNLFDVSPIIQLLDKGADLDRDVLPVLRARSKGRTKPRSWRFFVPAIVEAMQPNADVAKLPEPKTKADIEAGWTRQLRSHRGGYWNDHWGPPPGSPGCRIPAEFIAMKDAA